MRKERVLTLAYDESDNDEPVLLVKEQWGDITTIISAFAGDEAMWLYNKITKDDDGNGWVSVKDRLPDGDSDYLVTDGEACAVGFWRPDALAWDSPEYGWLENRSEAPYGIGTVTHWHPLPMLPIHEE